MAEPYKKVNRWDWDAMLDLFEAVTGYKPNQVVEGSLRVISRSDDEVVAEFQTFDPVPFSVDPESRYKDHVVHLHAAEKFEEPQP